MVFEPYNYSSFHHAISDHASRFLGGPAAGEPAPEIDLPTVEGSRFRLADFRGRRPVLVSFGSITCPLTAASSRVLRQLRNELGNRVEFVTVYVREAHPGERFPHHTSDLQKLDHARQWVQQDKIAWPVAVDTLDGRVHRSFGPLPNSVYLVGSDGVIAFRSLSGTNLRLLRAKTQHLLSAEARGERGINLGQDEHVMGATLQGAMEFDHAVGRAGAKAVEAYRREMGPLMYGVSKVLSRVEPIFHRESWAVLAGR